MLGLWCICAGIVLVIPAFCLPQGSEVAEVVTSESLASRSNGNETRGTIPKRLEEYSSETFVNEKNLKDNSFLRTWRVNKKALVPILVGMAIKALAIIPIMLTGLSIMGSLAILVSKTSLAISAIMFLRRFFSHDATHGGFFGLNPFNYPHGTIAPQDHHQPGYGVGNRRTTYVIRGRSHHLRNREDEIINQIKKASSKYENATTASSLNYSQNGTADEDFSEENKYSS